MDLLREIKEILEYVYLWQKYERTCKSMKQKPSPLMFKTYILGLIRSIHNLYQSIIFKIAKEYNFYCIELSETYKDNKFVDLNCRLVKYEIRQLHDVLKTLVNLCKSLISSKVQYNDIISDLSQIETIVEKFMSNPEPLSSIVREIEERRAQFEAEIRQFESMFDIWLEFMEAYGIILIERKSKITVYRCTECGYRTTSKYDIVKHCTFHLKIKQDQLNQEEIEESEENRE